MYLYNCFFHAMSGLLCECYVNLSIFSSGLCSKHCPEIWHLSRQNFPLLCSVLFCFHTRILSLKIRYSYFLALDYLLFTFYFWYSASSKIYYCSNFHFTVYEILVTPKESGVILSVVICCQITQWNWYHKFCESLKVSC